LFETPAFGSSARVGEDAPSENSSFTLRTQGVPRGSSDAGQQRSVELAAELANRFDRLSGTPSSDAATSIVDQRRISGHDLISVGDADGFRCHDVHLRAP